MGVTFRALPAVYISFRRRLKLRYLIVLCLFAFNVFPYNIISTFAADTSLTISEVMFYASSGNNEFVELYNSHSTQSINLSGYAIQYESGSPDALRSTGMGMLLPPESFAVILESDYDSLSGIYNSRIPPNALILKINSNAFGSNGMANTADRTIRLLRANQTVIESYTYSANNTEALSDEKVVLRNDNTPFNWANSRAVNGSPGAKNTVTPPDNDLGIAAFFADTLGTQLRFTITIKNYGAISNANYLLKLYYDANRNGQPDNNELMFQSGSVILQFGDSTNLYHTASIPDTGNLPFLAKLIVNPDENETNNSAVFIFRKQSIAAKAVIINEIMYAPENAEPEWIELFNPGVSSVQLRGGSISDRVSSHVITSSAIIAAGGYLIVCKDSTLFNYYPGFFPMLKTGMPALNNDSDAVVLRDSTGSTLDSLYYHAMWGGGAGRSLERMYADSSSTSPANWHTTEGTARATPGIINTVSPKQADILVHSITGLPAYTVLGESFNNTVLLKNNGKQYSGTITLRVLIDLNNDGIPQTGETISMQTVPSISPGGLASHTVQITANTVGRIRYFIHAAIDSDENTANDYQSFVVSVVASVLPKGSLVINEFMPVPETGQQEWIEIYNTKNTPVNLLGFRLADAADTVVLTGKNISIPAQGMIIVAGDSSIRQQYPAIPFLICNLPSLNDNGDNIMLLDSLARCIDSLRYQSQWLGSRGQSLERIAYAGASNDAANWNQCPVAGGTPGLPNTLAVKQYDLKITGVKPLPPYVLTGSESTITTLIQNAGTVHADSASLHLYIDRNLDSIAQSSELLLVRELPVVASNAVTEIICSVQHTVPGLYNYILKLIFDKDEAPYNNTLFVNITVVDSSVGRGTVCINEFMPAPMDGKAEWLELYNQTDTLITLPGLCIADAKDTVVMYKEGIGIAPKGYLVIAKDSSFLSQYHTAARIGSFPTLNDDADRILIMDSVYRIIDSIHYRQSWGIAKGISLEKIFAAHAGNDSLNWKTNYAGGTPGHINSASPKQFDMAIRSVSLFPENPTTGDSIKIVTELQNNGSSTTTDYTLTVFGDSPNKILFTRHIASALPSGEKTVIQSNSLILTDSVFTCTASILFTADEDTTNNSAAVTYRVATGLGSLIITEVMFAPENDKPEWIEIYNNTANPIDLQGWSISDAEPTPKKGIITESLVIPPGQYRVISNSNVVPPTLFWYCSFGALNNSGDGVILRNPIGKIVDSTRYEANWQIKTGRSLEKIRIGGSGTDRNNWHYALNSSGETPAAVNSCNALSVLSMQGLQLSEILFDAGTGYSEFVELYNAANAPLQLGGCYIRLQNGYTYPVSDTLFSLAPGAYFVLLSDTAAYSVFPELIALSNKTIANGFTMHNESGSITVYSPFATVLDSLSYNSSMHSVDKKLHRNRSLERISFNTATLAPGSWGSSPAARGASPAAANALAGIMQNIPAGVSFHPNPFSPDNDGYEDATEIRYNTPYQEVYISIRIFDDKGRLRRTFLQNHQAFGTGTITYAGTDDGGNALPMGMYIVLTEITDAATNQKKVYKQVLVSARKL